MYKKIDIPNFYSTNEKPKINIPDYYVTNKCTTYCEVVCETPICQAYCQGWCEYCEGCEGGCQTPCEGGQCDICETCQGGCQECQWDCMTTCEIHCEDCQTSCEDSCQNCQDLCEMVCEDACEYVQAPRTPTISVSNIKSTSIDVLVTDGVPGAIYATTVKKPGGYWYDYGAFSTSSFTMSTGFSPGLVYVLRIRTYLNGVYSDYSNEVTFTMLNRPEDWEWEYNIISGGNFYSSSGNDVHIMRAAHWNQFTDRISQFSSYVLGPEGNTVFTVAKPNDTPERITTQVNEAITYINLIVEPAYRVSKVVVGADVKAQTFIDMKEALNSIE